MATVKAILNYLDDLAPVGLKMDFDNVGLLIGRSCSEVTRAVTALDLTLRVIVEAKELGAQLIISHHPLFFDLKHVTDADPTGRRLLALAENHIAAICMHTNLDAAQGGVNECLADALGLQVVRPLDNDENISRLCLLPEIGFQTFMKLTCEKLGAAGLRYHDAGRPVHRVGICGGSGGQDILSAYEQGCDTFVTADVKHHQFLEAAELGINLIDAGHFPTEDVVIRPLTEKVAAAFPDVELIKSAVCSQPEKFYLP